MDSGLLSIVIADGAQVFMFLMGAIWSCRHRRILGVVGFGLLAISHVVTMLAGVGVVANDSTIVTLGVNFISPAIAMVLTSYVICPVNQENKKRWSML